MARENFRDIIERIDNHPSTFKYCFFFVKNYFINPNHKSPELFIIKPFMLILIEERVNYKNLGGGGGNILNPKIGSFSTKVIYKNIF